MEEVEVPAGIRRRLFVATWAVGAAVALVFTLRFPFHLLWRHFFRHECNVRLTFSTHLAVFSFPTFQAMRTTFVPSAVESGVNLRVAQKAAKLLRHPVLPIGVLGCHLFGCAYDYEHMSATDSRCRRCKVPFELRALQ